MSAQVSISFEQFESYSELAQWQYNGEIKWLNMDLAEM
jgi:hypothetical protein